MAKDVSVVTTDNKFIKPIGEYTYTELLKISSSIASTTALDITEKSLLQGVPHIITKLTWQSVRIDSDSDAQRGFVSVEATVGDEDALGKAIKRLRVVSGTEAKRDGDKIRTLDEFALDANERIVYNDGSTGIRRQLVEWLNVNGIISIGDVHANDIESFGKTAADVPWSYWAMTPPTTLLSEDDGALPVLVIDRFANGEPLLIEIRKGLHPSRYDGPKGPALTWYF